MFRHRYRPFAAMAALALVTLAAAACGDDDEDAEEANDDTTEQAPEGNEANVDDTGGGADLAAYCDAELGLETAPEPEVDWETASPEEIAEAVQAYATGTMRPLATELIAAAPDELSADVAVLDQALTELEGAGDFAVFETPDALAAQQALHVFDLDNCGWASVDVTLTDYAFEGIPEEVDAGVVSFELVNEGAEVHELLVLRKNDGVTQSAEELLSLPEEEAMALVTPVGAPATPAPGSDDYAVADLQPGDYVAVCFIPTGMTSFDAPPPADGAPHFVQGMVTEFTVS